MCAGSQADINVWVNYNNFANNANTAWAAAGFSGGNALTADDITALQNGIFSRMQNHYSGFTTNFVTLDPGGSREILNFGATTTSSGLYGQAAGIDWRNNRKNESANIYVHNFASIFPASTYTKAQAMERFMNAVSGTGSHELGHNLGLQHYDCYCHPTVQAPSYVTGGIQNTSIMATGSTGLNSTNRGVPRSFSQGEKLKLEFANGVAAFEGVTVAETGAAHGTLATAQRVFGTAMPISGVTAVNIDARASVSGQIDMYRFTAQAGSLITANTLSNAGIMPDTTNTAISLLDLNGSTLMSNDNITFSGNSFLQGSGGYSNDSLILNFTAGYTGDYYMRVVGTGSGDYDLLIGGLAVPEPATMAALGLGALALLRRRRKRDRSPAA